MTNLWLGAEYNQNYNDIETTHELMRQYLEVGRIDRNTAFFELLEAQVSCFGDPLDFYYDEVSRVWAGGQHTDRVRFRENVRQSVNYHLDLFNDKNPRLILIGGGLAFDAWRDLILPELQFNNLVVVRIRNPSRQAHRGNRDRWLNKYQNYNADLLPYNSGLRLLHLRCRNIDADFNLVELGP